MQDTLKSGRLLQTILWYTEQIRSIAYKSMVIRQKQTPNNGTVELFLFQLTFKIATTTDIYKKIPKFSNLKSFIQFMKHFYTIHNQISPNKDYTIHHYISCFSKYDTVELLQLPNKQHMLCISTSFWVLRAPESWLKYTNNTHRTITRENVIKHFKHQPLLSCDGLTCTKHPHNNIST